MEVNRVPKVIALHQPKITFDKFTMKLSVVEMRCAIWYHLYNLKNGKNIHGGVLLLVTLLKVTLLSECILTFLKLYKWYQIARRIAMLNALKERFSQSYFESFPTMETLLFKVIAGEEVHGEVNWVNLKYANDVNTAVLNNELLAF